MEGLYFHYAFCTKKCYYCGFYSSTEISLQQAYEEAMLKEMEQRKTYIHKPDTIYLGGGTPSLMSIDSLIRLFRKTEELWGPIQAREITMELNPEDCTLSYLEDLKKYTPINRLSIGVQSFDDLILKSVNRRHSGKEGQEAVERAQRSGFEKLSIDLMYGFQGQSRETWENDLKRFFSMGVSHLSAYTLTMEDASILKTQVDKGNYLPLAEEELYQRWESLCSLIKENGFERYETSNFCKNGDYAIHNTLYWKQQAYLGIGAGAHSYDLHSRQWNLADIKKYLLSAPYEKEDLSIEDSYNEYVMTAIRTCWGIEEEKIQKFSKNLQEHFYKEVQVFINRDQMQYKAGAYILKQEASCLADGIAVCLFK